MTPDVNVVLINFPGPEREAVTCNEDGSYTILINARLSDSGQLKAYEHAMEHIINDDFEKQDVQTIEAAAHEILKESPAPSVPSQNNTQRPRRKKRRRNRKQEQFLRERTAFIMEYCNVFALEEHNYLYGKDL